MAKTGDCSNIDPSDDLANWMSQLPASCHDLPLNSLAIPGSHDSFSSQLKEGEIAPDCSELIRVAEKLFGKAADKVIMSWSTTQNLDLGTQLEKGIRYFDLRVAYNDSCNDFQFVHGIYGPKIDCCMQEINSFLEKHQKELVILDFNHFYNVNPENHKRLLSMLSDIFGKKMCPFIGAANLTLNIAWEVNLQVVICYHHSLAAQQPIFWPGNAVQHLWANTDQLPKLIRAFEEEYRKGRPSDCFFNWQGILTPSISTVLQHLDGSLKITLAEKATSAITQWVADKSPCCKGLNIISVDFMQLYNFAHVIVQMNHNIQ
ncbi:PI-PLC X domain-containing protein 3 [Octopus vulgaris]|uniref:PI-PLC X domain-containing protein 3 n=2 Tax=Octopus TaxID=6643 RepID=A0AA36EYJ0_OCTVU|nr:PI-PLC X domain-containing protein 3-like [Octopus sinensis]CAI9717994.1 PI-PLC X domain-containing protein 3 [Octopus vulgaris]